ncbi:MAG: thiamine pyrophosphate-dependent dehydrogenase E1 component subunit alpha [Candidatus Eremiobacteraeota bacterium]|nr:thiamine pyrophosphate-dependent dehydrogenase E1 component subunit alpha [Candidatus Eremiobacteraeota bacterium]
MTTTSTPATTGKLERYGLSDDQLRAMLRNMLMQRQLDNRGFQLNRQGKIPFALGSEGHEAIQAGAAMAFIRGKDILAPYYRDLGLAVGIGFTPLEVLLSLFARAADHNGGRQFPNHYSSRRIGMMSFSSILAAQIPHAVGAAYALQYRNQGGRAVLVTFGDGTTSEGEWHESMNFAAVHRLPIVFLCENNQWAISTPLHKQMGQPHICKRAEGYGMPGEQFDGFDPIKTYDVVHRAMQRARSGGGPSLVEGMCYRFLAHSTDDDDRTYRTREEVEAQRTNDPVPRFERVLIDHKVMTPEQIDALRKDVLRETNQATDEAEAMPYPLPSDLYTNVHEGAWEPWQ